MGVVSRCVRRLLPAALLCTLALPVLAQTIHPVVIELPADRRHRAQGRFEIVNDGLTPLIAVLEPRSFDVSEDGEPGYRPLDPGVHLRLSAQSFRIPPQQSRTVFYDVTVDSLPSWFVIPCTLSGLPKRSGLDIRVELPHTVYVLGPAAPRRADIALRSAAWRQTERDVELMLENQGPSVARARSVELIGSGHREIAGSFPLLPHGRRRLRIPWSAEAGPERVVVRFDRFTIDQPFAEAAQAGD